MDSLLGDDCGLALVFQCILLVYLRVPYVFFFFFFFFFFFINVFITYKKNKKKKLHLYLLSKFYYYSCIISYIFGVC
jgi:hypothetical protein